MTEVILRAVVVVIGLRPTECQRLAMKVSKEDLPFELENAGHIENGSNAAKNAIQALGEATHVLWCLEGARYIPDLARRHPRKIKGVSSALNVLREIADSEKNDWR